MNIYVFSTTVFVMLHTLLELSEPLLAPVNTTVSFFCDPLFDSDSDGLVAHWIKDGIRIGSATRSTNLVVGGHSSYSLEDSTPQIGYLIISRITLDDSGKYWCSTDSRTGRIFQLQVAFIEKQMPLSPVSKFVKLHSDVTLPCNPPRGFPAPVIFWIKESTKTKVPGHGRMSASKDGSLFIRNFQLSDSGAYSCVARNIAGTHSSQVYIFSSTAFSENLSRIQSQYSCPLLGFLLWYIAGLLTTGVLVLSYGLFAVFCLKPNTRATVQPSCTVRPTRRWTPGTFQAVPL